MTGPRIIGFVEADGSTHSLLADRTWEVVRPDGERDHLAERSLSVRYDGDPRWGPHSGRFGVAILNDLAEILSGRVFLANDDPDPPGLAY